MLGRGRDGVGQGCCSEALDELQREEMILFMQIGKWCHEHGNLCGLSFYEWERGDSKNSTP